MLLHLTGYEGGYEGIEGRGQLVIGGQWITMGDKGTVKLNFRNIFNIIDLPFFLNVKFQSENDQKSRKNLFLAL